MAQYRSHLSSTSDPSTSGAAALVGCLACCGCMVISVVVGAMVVLPVLVSLIFQHIEDSCTLTGHGNPGDNDIYACTKDNWREAGVLGYAIAGLAICGSAMIGTTQVNIFSISDLIALVITGCLELYFSAMSVVFAILTAMAAQENKTVKMSSVGIVFNGFDLGAWTIGWCIYGFGSFLIIVFVLTRIGCKAK